MDNEFHWQDCWYPVVFSKDLPADKPYSFELYGEALVLFFDDQDQVCCLRDRCPHRAARLSDGHVVDGKLECLYHGWQFDHSGRCVHIPQMLADKAIPERACTKSFEVQIVQGIVWIWAGESATADLSKLPSIDNFDAEDIFSVDYIIDLPYDQTYLIENIIDVAHIHVAHHGLRGGGHRSMAMPLNFEVSENSVNGISASYQSVGLEINRDLSAINRAEISFVAPNLIHYITDYKDKNLIAGLALYSLPLTQGKCRLLYRKYSNFYSWKERAKPRFIEHWIQNQILQQDMALIIGQYEEIERSDNDLKDVWLPIKSSDTLVIMYRKWLDKFAIDSPMFRGFSSHSNTASTHDLPKTENSVFNLHTRHCSSCKKVYKLAGVIQLVVLAIVALLLPALLVLGNSSGGFSMLVFYVIGLAVLAATYLFRRKFQ